MATSGIGEVTVRSAAGLGRALHVARIARGLTQGEVAELARTDRFSVAQIESGRSTRAVEKLFDALAALDLELVVRQKRGWSQ